MPRAPVALPLAVTAAALAVTPSYAADEPAGVPNVVIVLLDDVGFGAASSFGGPIETPALERLAATGLRYNRFHTTGICSPTRAALLTGRNPHAVGVGAVMNSASNYEGYRGVIPPSAATIAEILRQNGYRPWRPGDGCPTESRSKFYLITEPTLIRQWGTGGVWSRCTAAEAEVVKPWDYTTIRFMI